VKRIEVDSDRGDCCHRTCHSLQPDLCEAEAQSSRALRHTGVYMAFPGPQVSQSLGEEDGLLSKQGTNILATFRDKHDVSAGTIVSCSFQIVVSSNYWR
jgi:hypothetical protein